MKLPLRIRFEDQDYSYTILNNTLDRTTREFRILLADQEYTLLRNEKNEWSCPDLTINDNPALLIAIARSIGLRYQL
ncbi:hypothetical protein [Pedobacter sp. MC2016-24]|uniref:hypothetical protein n=1 Tax=Pedobacter sp. MC2016-24 TaxID=2780090 RepID=UPI00187E2439|nr:hypothetical protein [Pedobacter sp. MC2016-24]MBE9599876.1 hypothetical protein [Pedobacter sp. MC2016-24]